jgi:hypothetical protein
MGQWKVWFIQSYIRCPVARVDDVPHMLSSPVHGLHAIAHINVANSRVGVVSRGHHLQALTGERWALPVDGGQSKRVVEHLGRYVLVPPILSLPHVCGSPKQRGLCHGQRTGDRAIGHWMWFCAKKRLQLHICCRHSCVCVCRHMR